MNIIEKIFGTHSERELKSVYAIADKIESYRPQMQALSDEELRGKTKEYKERLAKGALPGTAHRWYRSSSGTYRRDEDR